MLAVLVLLLAADEPPAAGSSHPVYGVWRSHLLEARIKIAPCEGGAICGTLLSATRPEKNPELLDVHNKNPSKRQLTLIGQPILEGFKGGPRKWTGGHVYNPEDGKHYTGSITLVDSDHLHVKGCVLRVLCKTQTLTRVEQAGLPPAYSLHPHPALLSATTAPEHGDPVIP